MDFHGMKRKELQALCKNDGIPANLTNREMADRLSLLVKEDEKTGIKGLGEADSEIDSVVVAKNVKKVRFSPENETFIFVGTDVESESDMYDDFKSKKKKNLRKKTLTSKNVMMKKNNIEENPVRVTRSRARSAVEDDSQKVSSAFVGKKRGRRVKETVDVCVKPPPIVGLGDGIDVGPAVAESKREEGTRLLRGRKVVIEAGGKGNEGDIVVPRKKFLIRGAEKTGDGKGSNGVLSVDESFEENVMVETANPRQISGQSIRNLTKDESSNGLSKYLGKTSIGGRTRRSQTQITRNDSAVGGECRVVESKKESRNVLQLEEPAKGASRYSLRRKSVAGKKESVDETYEENITAEAANPKKILNPSNQHLTRDEGSNALKEDLGKIAIGGRTRRSQFQTTRNDYVVGGDCGIVESKKEGRNGLQLEEPSKGIRRYSLRRNSVAGQKESIASEILASERTEHGPMLKKESRKQTKKTEVEDVSTIEPSGDTAKQFLPDGLSRRTRRHTRMFSPAAKTTDGQLITHEVDGRRNPSREATLEIGANIVAKPLRKCARNASKQISTEVSDKLGEVAVGVTKYGRKKKTQELILNKESCKELVKNKPTGRSTGAISKRSMVEPGELTTMVAEKNKQHEARKPGEGSCTKTTLPLKETPVIDGLVAAEASKRRIDPDLFCSKEGIEMSGEQPKRLRRESAVTDQLGSVQVSAVNNEVVDITSNLVVDITPNLVVDITPSLEGQVSKSALEHIVMQKERNIVEECKENFLAQNVQVDVDDQLCNSLNAVGDTGDYNLVEPAEYPNKITDVCLNSPVDNLSPTCHADSEGGCSNLLYINEGVESEEGTGENPGSDGVDDYSAEEDKARIQEDQYLAELDLNGNLEAVQDLLNEVYQSQKLERNSENSSLDAEKLSPVASYVIIKETVQEIHFGNIVPRNTVTVPIKTAPESHDEKVGTTGSKNSSDDDIGNGVFKEEAEPGSPPHFTLEKLQEGKERASLSASNEIASASGKVIEEASNEVVQTVPQIQQPYFGELENHKDVALELNKDASFAAHNFVAMDEIAKVEEKLEKLQEEKMSESPSGSNEILSLSCEIMDASDEVMQTVPRIQQPHFGELDSHKDDVALESNKVVSFASYNLMSVDDKANVEDKLEKLQEEKECDSPSGSIASLSCGVIQEASNEVTQTLLQIQQSPFGEVQNKIDVALELSTSASFAARNLLSRDGKANAEDELGRMDSESNTKDYSEREKEDDVVVTDATPCNTDSYLVKGGVFDVNDSDQGVVLNHVRDNIQVPQAEADATFTKEKVNRENMENANKWKEEYSSKLKLTTNISCDSPGSFSRFGSVLNISPSLGDEYGSHNSSGDRIDTTEKETTTVDRGYRVTAKIKSTNIRNNEDLLVDTNGLNQENAATTSEFSQALLNDQKGAAEDAAFVKDTVGIVSNKTFCASGAENDTKQTEEALDNKPIESDEVKDVGVLKNFSLLFPVKQNMDVDCFLLSSGNRNSELHVQYAEIITSKKNMDLGDGEKDQVENLYEVLVEATLEGKRGEGDKEVKEKLIMNKKFDLVSERQLGEHGHSSDSASKELISDDGEGLSGQKVVSAIIQEYLDHEIHTDEFLKTGDSDAFVREGKMMGVAEIKVYESGAVEDAETNCVAEFSIDNMVKDSGEKEEREACAMTAERTEIGEEISSLSLPVGAMFAESLHGIEHSKLSDAARGKESPCHVYKNLVTECEEEKDRGTDLKDDLTGEGNNELGTDQRGSGHISMLKESERPDDFNCLYHSNLFGSNDSKINSKKTKETLNLHSPENIASNDTADVEVFLSIMKPEIGVQRSDVCSLTASSSECMQSMAEENNVLECNDEMPSFTGFELKKHSEDSERDEVEKLYARNSKDNFMGETGEEVKNEEDTVVGISEVSAERLQHHDNGMVVEVEIPKENQLAASDEHINETEDSKQKDILSVINQGCLNLESHEDVSFAVDESAEATEIIGSISTDPTNGKDMMETMELIKDESEENTTNVKAVSDEPSSENGGSTEEGEPSAKCDANVLKQVESYSETGVEGGVTFLTRIDPTEDMVETMELSKEVSEIKATSSSAASEEKCNVASVFNEEGVDCEFNKDDSVGFENSIETTEINGCSSDSKRVEDLEGMQSPGKRNLNDDTSKTMELSKDESKLEVTFVDQYVGKSNLSEDISNTMELSKGDSELRGATVDQFLVTPGNVVASEDAEAWPPLKLESHQENGKESNLMESISESAIAEKNDCLVSAHPKNRQKFRTMKENLLSTKREQVGNITASKRSERRRPLEDLQNH
ncbi:hypothetical protein PanWU01x14_233440 [Parasponia andersonii]|uniref:Uncharacterized protein n=1 Tax=Parasponia andersonii TaxID=3476 RepID=A0A2P5BJJ4_PARAD|nr:hypothetical protein PanWU01x14_233440 [Parasponia andersonii]